MAEAVAGAEALAEAVLTAEELELELKLERGPGQGLELERGPGQGPGDALTERGRVLGDRDRDDDEPLLLLADCDW